LDTTINGTAAHGTPLVSPNRQRQCQVSMDCRVKPGNDD
jgi:hypothetical protein